MKTYEEVVAFLYAQLPAYQRVGAAAYKPDIGNIVKLCDLLGNPHRAFKSIHIAGTNGKGSVAHMIASVYQEAGLKTGLYTSPHLIDFRERVKVNGQNISKTAVIEFTNTHKDMFADVQPSFFEWTVALAFKYFADEQVDVAIIETGLGGRLDSTNILQPELSIITSISKDHEVFLGSDLLSIAREKAGIIKFETPVVLGKLPGDVENEIRRIAQDLNAPVYRFDDAKAKETDLLGSWQHTNSQMVSVAVDCLQKTFNIQQQDLLSGLKNVRSNTGLRGRWEQLSDKPVVICDVGHNVEAIDNILAQITQYQFQQLRMVLGFAGDKDLMTIAGKLPKNAQYYLCEPKLSRAMPVEKAQNVFNEHGLNHIVVRDCVKAYETALEESSEEDFVFIGGSTFVLSEILK